MIMYKYQLVTVSGWKLDRLNQQCPDTYSGIGTLFYKEPQLILTMNDFSGGSRFCTMVAE